MGKMAGNLADRIKNRGTGKSENVSVLPWRIHEMYSQRTRKVWYNILHILGYC